MQGFSLDNSVALICGGAAGLVALFCLLSFVSMLSARTADAGSERAAAFAISAMALALGLVAFWSATSGMGEAFARTIDQIFGSFGIPVALFQIQASIAAIIIAFFAWRFPRRDQ